MLVLPNYAGNRGKTSPFDVWHYVWSSVGIYMYVCVHLRNQFMWVPRRGVDRDVIIFEINTKGVSERADGEDK